MKTTNHPSANHDADQPDIDQCTGDRVPSDSCLQSSCVAESTPVETFALLANEDRLAILKAIIEADERGEVPLSFSTLRDSVAISDSGRFSYHLGELTGRLLSHSADGYSLHENCCGLLVEGIAAIEL